jgi:putative transposase
MDAVTELAPTVGTWTACNAVGVPRASYYRQRRRNDPTKSPPQPKARPKPRRALSDPERQAVLDVLHQPRFIDQTPHEVYATLLDEGVYLCSIRTMYRILAVKDEVRERRKVTRHTGYQKPELLAVAPNQVWSWDITKLKGPVKLTYFYLYVILDIFSRRVVGWYVADVESATLFKELFEDAVTKHNVPPGQLTLHADRGGPMTAKTTGQLLADLGVTKSHSRPYTSNDNPFSESQFKTLKYQPEFPERFGSREDAVTFSGHYFAWYNESHHHTGIGLMTPNQVHYGIAGDVHAARQNVLDDAFARNPERFVKKPPTPPAKPTEVWINLPQKYQEIVPAANEQTASGSS